MITSPKIEYNLSIALTLSSNVYFPSFSPVSEYDKNKFFFCSSVKFSSNENAYSLGTAFVQI